MQVIDPNVYKRRLRKEKRKSRLLRFLALSGVGLIVTYIAVVGFRYAADPPRLLAETSSIKLAAGTPTLAFPAGGQAAVGAVGYGVLENAGNDEQRPIASITKVVTALTVLDKKPLKQGEQGPLLTMTAADVSYYDLYFAKNGTVTKVSAGGQISQYQALQALLLASSNNMADSLAVWAFGSMDAYVEAANGYLTANGFTKTRVADASGFSPQSVSAARELIKLGELAIKDSVVSGIVSQGEATLPMAGRILNVNSMLGQDGIDGIKTGNTDEAGGCFLTTAEIRMPSGDRVRVLAVVLGAPTRAQALTDAQRLLVSAKSQFVQERIPAGTVVGYYNVPWAARVAAVSAKDILVTKWIGQEVRAKVALQPAKAGLPAGSVVGRVSAPNGSEVETTLTAAIPQPSQSWRFWRAVAF